MGRRTLLVITSILVAAVGTAMIWAYVSNADARARQDWQELVSVWVAKQSIDAGSDRSTISDSSELVRIPRKVAPIDAIGDLRTLVGKTNTVPILAGQYLVTEQFDPTAGTNVADKKMGVAIALDDPNRVAGLLRPGSRVAIYWLPNASGGTAGKGDGATAGGQANAVRLLLPDVTVLAIGGATESRNQDGGAAQVGTATGVGTGIVTLDVNGAQATRVILARATGELYFTVLGKDAKPQTSDDASPGNLLGLATGAAS
jgi:pilus assembly protein CpaB